MKVGLALSGGGARGFAHAGVLKVLVEAGIPVDLIAGTSAGSFAGGAFAAGMSPREMAEMTARLRWRNMARQSLSPRGLLSNVPMGNFIDREFPIRSFSEIKIPFAAVACDLQTASEVLVTEGDLSAAIRASCAIPGVFAPVRDGTGRSLVDGGVVSPTPVDAVRRMGAEVVIAVDLIACGVASRAQPRTALGIVFQSAMTLLRTAAIAQHYDADIVIIPELAHVRPDDLSHGDDCVRLGEAAARDAIEKIKEVVNG